jgi:hypothetical protein
MPVWTISSLKLVARSSKLSIPKSQAPCAKHDRKLSACLVLLALAAGMATPVQAVDASFNGLDVRVDETTGGLLRLSYRATGRILEAPANLAGILTVSYPLKEFVGLQLEPRFSSATVTQTESGLTMNWSELRAGRRDMQPPGGTVSASVRLRAAPDGRSMILSAQVKNDSKGQASQILFPDLRGLRPFDDPKQMELRMALGAINPFAAPVRPKDRTPFYPNTQWLEYPASGQYERNALRWMDYGSLKGGMSLFEKRWAVEPRPGILVHRSEADPDFLRVVWQHKIELKPGESWESAEYWLTPHPGGWAKGIEVFREYVAQVNPARQIPVPDRIKNGLGFQTVWLIQNEEPDAARAAFRFSDIPEIARDAKAHGIDELLLWNWSKYGDIPIRHRAELGTVDELKAAISGAKAAGVNVSHFVNVKNVDDRHAARYGVRPGNSASWTYHPELIPTMFPFSRPSGQIDVETTNPVWQEDVFKVLTEWVDRGITSWGWDVFDDEGDMALINLISRVRGYIRPLDPTASFVGEPAGKGSLERATQVLDYTWNWLDYVEAGPFLNVLRYPRFNVNVERSARIVKMSFADGLYINAYPKLPDEANGTLKIGAEPELSAALKEVAPLRKHFLKYFVAGNFLGDSVLRRPVVDFVRTNTGSWIGGATVPVGEFEYPTVFVRGYQLPDRLLFIVLNNDSKPQAVKLESDLSLWLPQAQSYRVTYYDSRGKSVRESPWRGGAHWTGTSAKLDPLELAFFEVATH